MTTDEKSKRDLFLECDWSYDIEKYKNYNYTSLCLSLHQAATDMQELGKIKHYEVLLFLSYIASLSIVPERQHEPYKHDSDSLREQLAAFRPAHMVDEDFIFLESILDDVKHPLLRARLADLLWVYQKPRNHLNARKAIDAYTEIPIEQNWKDSIEIGWERAITLSLQIRDNSRVDRIKAEMFDAIRREISNPENHFLSLTIGRMLDRTGIDKDYRGLLGQLFFTHAECLKGKHSYGLARQFYELAVKKYYQLKDNESWANSLLAIAQCFEMEAEAFPTPMQAHESYERALLVYRSIPNKSRKTLGIEDKIDDIQRKIAKAGEDSLAYMVQIPYPKTDFSDVEIEAKNYVSGKSGAINALIYFVKLYQGPNYEEIENNAKQALHQSFFPGLYSVKHLDRGGRVFAKSPATNKFEPYDGSVNEEILEGKILELFKLEISRIVQHMVMPALEQITHEYRISKDLLRAICEASPIIPRDRIMLMVDALWYGFEYEFAASIHLLCPQIENIVRIQLNNKGAITLTRDEDGVANENGLSTLMKHPEIVGIFGKNLSFEIESIFSKALGYNLRNNVAHGLLNDAEATSSVGCIYAWWMTLRIILKNWHYKQINFG
ncbi:DUF4209 domain-containing protein [Acinetobacter baumannii]|uniref:DUF4209 domain-containing protein n=1 Tax=Acinetobacter baumannii TaxID=470 RepID=UPI000BBCAFCC|nr:DUF4209 domain-containing protein [Acinetobacter baumannii]MDC4301237.1 DUF4209 domain-containing protein [Acinetobacter baumannii]MDC4640406.1 DUF4209 domain-containing protein [Acinetobacter baumannii]MDC4765103.1 DUF4209 domain-containing protein [Acinetobacter baumannii]MDC4861665.1 DUF4209 domain-containing protein [Acinetobacter baumannii]MDC5511602.1 DUF4209 domain-containing protein [Acinetobacter baumannii]